MKTLETPRLVLRGFREADANDVFEYAQNPNVGPPAGWRPHTSRDESLRIVQMFMQARDVWALVEKETGKVIGSLGLHRDDKRANPRARMLGYVLSQTYWGRGLTMEACRAAIRHAFEAMPVDLISVYHYPFNTQSKRVIEKCGFRYEGTLRRATVIFSGALLDEVCYSLTREEWQAR